MISGGHLLFLRKILFCLLLLKSSTVWHNFFNDPSNVHYQLIAYKKNRVI